MNKLRFFAALCCVAAVFAACENNDPKGGSKSGSKDESTTDQENSHDWVDLGLPSGTKWATCNVGASKPELYGNYYAWGEIKPKSYYSEENYTFKSSPYTLGASNDAASANWGNDWRTPTRREWIELCNNCAWIWTDDYNGTGAAGHKVVSNTNGNFIFLPAAGHRYDDKLSSAREYGSYWSSSLSNGYPDFTAWDVSFSSSLVYKDYDSRRYFGHSVRPVYGRAVTDDYMTIAEALAIVDGLSVGVVTSESYTISGTVTHIVNTAEQIAQYGNCSFYMTDGTNEIQAFRTKGYRGDSFTDGLINVGDQVSVEGPLMKYVSSDGTVIPEIYYGKLL